MRSPRSARSPILLAVACAAGVGAWAPVASASFVGEAVDPAGDATAPEPERDITAAGVGYDPATGRMAAAIRLRGPAAGAPATLVAYAGRRTPTGCDRGPTVGFASVTDRPGASWLRLGTDGGVLARGTATKRGGSTTIHRLDVQDTRLRGQVVDCALVSALAPDGGATTYDQLSFDLVGQPSLGLRLTGVPSSVRASNRRYAMRIAVSNPGSGPTGRVRVRVKSVRGVTPSRTTVSLPSVAPGTTRTTTVRVRFSSRARLRTTVPVTASAGRLEVEAERAVRVVQPKRTPPRGGGGGGGGQASTCVRYFPDPFGDSGGSLGLVPCQR